MHVRTAMISCNIHILSGQKKKFTSLREFAHVEQVFLLPFFPWDVRSNTVIEKKIRMKEKRVGMNPDEAFLVLFYFVLSYFYLMKAYNDTH
jgi:hypothetical protein